jgi:hypothetical protein
MPEQAFRKTVAAFRGRRVCSRAWRALLFVVIVFVRCRSAGFASLSADAALLTFWGLGYIPLR